MTKDLAQLTSIASSRSLEVLSRVAHDSGSDDLESIARADPKFFTYAGLVFKRSSKQHATGDYSHKCMISKDICVFINLVYDAPEEEFLDDDGWSFQSEDELYFGVQFMNFKSGLHSNGYHTIRKSTVDDKIDLYARRFFKVLKEIKRYDVNVIMNMLSGLKKERYNNIGYAIRLISELEKLAKGFVNFDVAVNSPISEFKFEGSCTIEQSNDLVKILNKFITDNGIKHQ